MKKRMATLLIGAMAAMTLLGGCGSDDSTGDSSASAEAEEESREVKAKELLAATDYDVKKYVTLMDDYMNLTVELDSDYAVTDEAVQSYMESVLAYYPVYTQSDKLTVESGDIVNIDYEGTLNGEAFDGGTATGYNLTIGSGSFIDGFEDGLIGANVGDSLDLDLTFPDDYSSEDLAGQAVVFHVTINGIMNSETPTVDTIDDDYVNENFSSYGLTTVDDLTSYCESYLESEYESEKQSAIQSEVLEMLLDGCTVEFPEGLLDERVDNYVSSVKTAAEEAGSEFEDYISSNYGYDTEEDFTTYVSDSLSGQLTQELILEAIVADQKTSINTADFNDFVDQYVSYYGSYYGFESADDLYEYYGGEEYVMLSYAENVAFQAVLDGVTTTVVESTDDADTSADAESTEDTDTSADAESTGDTDTSADAE